MCWNNRVKVLTFEIQVVISTPARHTIPQNTIAVVTYRTRSREARYVYMISVLTNSSVCSFLALLYRDTISIFLIHIKNSPATFPATGWTYFNNAALESTWGELKI
jgi:hypothetical protein